MSSSQPNGDAPWRVDLIEDERVARLTLAAGRGNVLTIEVLGALRTALEPLADTASLRAVVLAADGPDFSFGASVQDHLPGRMAEMLAAMNAAARALLDLDLPLLAAVQGLCFGGGLELALLADRLVAAPDAQFATPEITLGVFAPLGSLLLPRAIGDHRAFAALVDGRPLFAEPAREAGLVQELAVDPVAAQLAWARYHLFDKSAFALRQATRAARMSWAPRLFEDLAHLERQYVEELMGHPDPVEGLTAFLEKREPRWTCSRDERARAAPRRERPAR